MNVTRFSNGGFVVHRIGGERISAWYAQNGTLIDCERIDSLGRSRKPAARWMPWIHAIGQRHAVRQVTA